ncbi:ribbon-helix-helix domain-containing protein [Haloarcula brevis]|uniref:transcriptional regulator n=1 Tax=Haloarcula brevis TaxID=3111453 RepID=UPI00300EA23C
MVKSTVRFPETVMDCVEEMVAEGVFSNKSEFQRFAVEYVLSEIDDYEPEMVDFDELQRDVFQQPATDRTEMSPEINENFYENAARVRQFAIRGEIETAEEYIDTAYPVTDPRCLLLDDLLEPYRQRAADDDE